MSEVPANGLSIAGPAFQISMMCAIQSGVTLTSEFAGLLAGFSICRKKGGAPMKNPHSESSSPAVVREDSQRGAALLEYALVVALVSVVGISGVNSMGVIVKSKFMTASERLAVGTGTIIPCEQDPSQSHCNITGNGSAY